jgi:ubiquinone/menaquinone biosynthesis C-methylase UbiE
MHEIELQRQYYERTTDKFDEWHIHGDTEHVLACQSIISFLEPRFPNASILDIGAGTGRFYCYVRDARPGASFKITGLEPSEAQRRTAYNKGVPREQHIAGDATAIAFPDDAFDFCTEFGVLHHIKDHRRAVREMCRVASKGLFLSDSNKYGQGSLPLRLAKQALRLTRTWPLMDYVRTGGRGYQYCEGDGYFYSFSVFDVLDIVREKFPNIYLWPTKPVTSPNLFMGCPYVLVIAQR